MKLLVSLSLVGCTSSAVDALPPSDQLFYPTALAIGPDDRVLFVANANSDLRYNTATVDAIDLALVDETIAAWSASGTIPADCARDGDHRETLVCDETRFVLADAAARTGNFATAIAVQDRGGGRARLVVPTRGDPSVAWIDWDGARLSCNADGTTFADCDEDHRLINVLDDPDVGTIPGEPFDVFVDSEREFAVVTHFTNGAVTLIDSSRDGRATISDVASGYFAEDANGSAGTCGVTGTGGVVYVGSPYEDRIQAFTVGRPVNAPPFLIGGAMFFLDGVGDNAGGSTDTRALAMASAGDRMYALNRFPPSLMQLDVTDGSLVNAVDVCRQGERIAVAATDDGDRVFVSCFADGEIYIVDPRGAGFVEDVISSGRGPYSIVASASRGRVYVTNNLEDSISVIDTSSTSPTKNHVVLKLGEPKPP